MHSMEKIPCHARAPVIGRISFLKAPTAVCDVNIHCVEELILGTTVLQCVILYPAVA
jgi:hypothetical protein